MTCFAAPGQRLRMGRRHASPPMLFRCYSYADLVMFSAQGKMRTKSDILIAQREQKKYIVLNCADLQLMK